jgi:hypothetical protein
MTGIRCCACSIGSLIVDGSALMVARARVGETEKMLAAGPLPKRP